MVKCIRSTNLILLPGMMCNETLWSRQVEELAADSCVQVGDITGADSIAALASSVLERAPARFALAGLSMGGIVALAMWRQAPERIERLALLDTNYRADTVEKKHLRDRQMAAVAGGGLDAVLRDELKPNYLAQCHRGNLSLLADVLAMGQQLGERIFMQQSQALRDRPDSSATLATISCPTLVLCGAEDRLCPEELHRDMAAGITGAQLRVIADCGHLSSMEQPQQVTMALQDWLRAN